MFCDTDSAAGAQMHPLRPNFFYLLPEAKGNWLRNGKECAKITESVVLTAV